MLAAACLSLVVDARYLNQTLEFLTSAKKLTLLLSYGMLFVIVASSIRRAEVPAFLKYTLVLAVLCALGTIWEYRFHYNVFYGWSDKLLPGFFTVGHTESSAVDEIGRRIVIGPGEISLEAAAMLSMGLPIALVGIMSSPRWRGRLLYGLAASILMAGAISTFRKTALIAPVSAILTLAYYRRRELVRLAPLGVVVLVAVHLLSPGAFGAIAEQLHPTRLDDVSTVSDRTSDYDAVRPDVWTHVAFGRGYGSYEHTTYRVLDMEMLRQLIEVGVVGLAAYIMLMVSIVATARAPIRRRRPDESRVALAAAATAVSFLVISTLFDVMSFPHCPYILLWMAGLLAVVVTNPPAKRRPTSRPRRRPRPDATARHGGCWRCSPSSRGRRPWPSPSSRPPRASASATRPRATSRSVLDDAHGGDTILLASGDYGTFAGAAKKSTVTIKPAPGAQARIQLELHTRRAPALRGSHVAGAKIARARARHHHRPQPLHGRGADRRDADGRRGHPPRPRHLLGHRRVLGLLRGPRDGPRPRGPDPAGRRDGAELALQRRRQLRRHPGRRLRRPRARTTSSPASTWSTPPTPTPSSSTARATRSSAATTSTTPPAGSWLPTARATSSSRTTSSAPTAVRSAITIGSDDGSIVRRNTLPGGSCDYHQSCGILTIGAGNEGTPSRGTVVEDNVLGGLTVSGGSQLGAKRGNLIGAAARGKHHGVGAPSGVGPAR